MNDHLANLRNRFQDWYDGLHFTRGQRQTLAVVSIGVLLVSAFIFTRGKPEQVVMAQTPAVKLVVPKLVVDVAGGVKNPGVYTLPANSRVADALSAAGGARKGTDTSVVNLARLVRDGEQIYLDPPVTTSPLRAVRSRAIQTSRSDGTININRASEKELESLPGIGPVLALKIFTYRSVNGPFSRIEDLQKVSGIGSAKFAALKTKVHV